MAKCKPRGLRNNNPGNIRQNSIRYSGEIQPSKDAAFKQFQSMAYGYRAMFVVLHTYARKYGIDTIERMISRYAPANENHTQAYIDAVSAESGVSPTSHLTSTNADVMIPIVAAMSRVENGEAAVMSEVEAGWKMFITDYRNHLV
jgi:hypothetical protein